MKIIFGLGNPGAHYARTRHNTGFMVIDELARRIHCSLKEKKRWQADVGQAKDGQADITLVKPLTFMNNSGICASMVIRALPCNLDEILVVYDEIDLPLGTLRLRPGGSSGGHKGLASILHALGTTHIARMRIGIGRNAETDTADYVLSLFAKNELAIVAETIQQAVDCCLSWVHTGCQNAMTTHNRRAQQT